MDGGRAQGTTEEGGTSEKPLILVIEDDAVMQELLRLHLTNAGYKVLVAENGIAGGYLVLSGKPDLLLVDVDMPYMSGYELVEALKADPLTLAQAMKGAASATSGRNGLSWTVGYRASASAGPVRTPARLINPVSRRRRSTPARS